MRRTLALVVLFVAMIAAAAGRAQFALERAFPPVDEASKDPGFEAFRTRLRDIIARRDLAGLIGVTSPTIMYSFGEGPGIAGFRRYYGLDDEKSELWAELDRVLALGGTFQGADMFVTPYVYSRWPEDLEEPIDYVALTARETEIHTAPRSDASVVRRLRPSIVLSQPDATTPEGWHRVLLLDGVSGYVTRGDARSAIDMRAFFARMPSGWMMVICIAGD